MVSTKQRRKRAPSGRFLLRLEPELHAALQAAARRAGVSLNEYCARKLGAPLAALELGPAAEAVRRATAIHGDRLAGVLAFGSWARGEAGPQSDVDVLIVLDDAVPLTRGLYRAWDDESLRWGPHLVQTHLVHLPAAGAVGTIWAEAAIDGIVLFERDLSISRRLALVRRDIAEGRLVRRNVHGQPYWAEVA